MIPVRNNLISVAILGLVFTVIAWIITSYIPGIILFGFIFGCGVSLFFSFGKLGANPDNMSDYMETNKEYLKY